MPSTYADVAHLLSRSGFGATAAEVKDLMPMDWADLVDHVLDTSQNPSTSVDAPDMSDSRGWSDRYKDMVNFWVNRSVSVPKPLQEKMVLFWHGLLCSELEKVESLGWMFDQNQLFRRKGLGNFTELIQDVSVQPAMLKYLDNDKNLKGSPNENFARELMELFTLGVGNYTEEDVRSAARAWTGHILVNKQYQFVGTKHDNDPKTFFGVTKNWNGPQIVDEITKGSKQQTCARFISKRLWQFMAYPEVSDAAIDATANSFINSNMNIRALLRSIFLHPEFRSTQSKNGLLKSPIELAIGVMKHTGISTDSLGSPWIFENLGQRPFAPPNVAGWGQNLYWVNNTTMWLRFKFATNLRWRLYNETSLLEGSHLLDQSEAVDNALKVYALRNVSAASRASLEYYSTQRRASTWPKGERVGLLVLPILCPEYWMA